MQFPPRFEQLICGTWQVGPEVENSSPDAATTPAGGADANGREVHSQTNSTTRRQRKARLHGRSNPYYKTANPDQPHHTASTFDTQTMQPRDQRDSLTRNHANSQTYGGISDPKQRRSLRVKTTGANEETNESASHFEHQQCTRAIAVRHWHQQKMPHHARVADAERQIFGTTAGGQGQGVFGADPGSRYGHHQRFR